MDEKVHGSSAIGYEAYSASGSGSKSRKNSREVHIL